MRPRIHPWVGKFPWGKARLPTPVFLSGESHGQRSLVGCSPWGDKVSDMTEQLTLSCFLKMLQWGEEEVVIYWNKGENKRQSVLGIQRKSLQSRRQAKGITTMVRRHHWRRQWQATPVPLPGKSHGRRSLVSCSPQGRKESDTTEWLQLHFHFHTLEKEMATHSSVLAWRIPGTGKPGGLHSVGSHRVGHDWRDVAATAAARRHPRLPL